MKKVLGFVVIVAFIAACLYAMAASKPAKTFNYYPMNIKVEGLLKEPRLDSEAAFNFPIDVRLTGISADKKWYRFRVTYDLVFLGNYEFEGWCRVDPWKPFETGATPEVIKFK